MVLELRCVKCKVGFKKTIEERRRTTDYNEGEMAHLLDQCPNKCGGEWFAIEKVHSIRKFKRRE